MRVGSLFSGYGGLDMAVTATLGGSVAWHSEIDRDASAILAHHWPDVPNHGDLTAVDWSQVEPVDVLTGGFPCQDVSSAGKRAGMRPDTRSGLWAHMAHAIDQLRPALVVAENVRGLLSATADSDVEPCPWCLGDGTGEPVMRALGAVLSDLAGLGYDARWCGLRAADVGAPHGRFRVFVVATDTARDGRHERRSEPTGIVGGLDVTECGSPTANADGDGLQSVGRVNPIRRHPDRRSSQNQLWGRYEPAIRQWEHTLGRPAPAPTEPGRNGNPRLAPAFVEWLMGLPEGHVTGVPISRNAQLKALGNGVVPQQAAAALTHMLTLEDAAA